MKPHDEYHNGDDDGASDSESGSEGGAPELWVEDREAPARALAALNALRKSRQHYDMVLVAGGTEVPAHRALLAAASPYLLASLGAPAPPASPAAAAPDAAAYRVHQVPAHVLKELVEYIYTGRLRARDATSARQLYCGAWRLRLESARNALAERLVRRPQPQDVLETRALPDLPANLQASLDAYIAEHFDEMCEVGALAAVPLVRVEMLRASSAAGGEEAPPAVASAALAWLRARAATHSGPQQAEGSHDVIPKSDKIEELCSRAHLVFVDAGGALRDCGELPAARGDAPELAEYKQEAQARALRPPPAARPARTLPGLELGERAPNDSCVVLAAKGAQPTAAGEYSTEAVVSFGRAEAWLSRAPPFQPIDVHCWTKASLVLKHGFPTNWCRVTRALLSLRGALLAARIAWRDGADVAVGGPLGGAPHAAGAEACRAPLAAPRCAHGAAVLGNRLIVCGGYDRARALRSVEAYSASTNEWRPLAELKTARARFPAAELRGRIYVCGGSDGHTELSSADMYIQEKNTWERRAQLPSGVSHAALCADSDNNTLWLIGGWAGGRSLRAVHKYDPVEDKWSSGPPLSTGRSQCAGVVWERQLWALGGCDTWHCLASTETLSLDAAAEWMPGIPLSTARRSMGGCVWRGRLVVAGGSDGGCSLRRVDWLLAGAAEGAWRGGPELRRARAGLTLHVLDDVLYAVAGFDGKEFLSCVECLYSPDGEWTTLCSPPAPRSPPATPASPSPTPGKERNGGDGERNGGNDELNGGNERNGNEEVRLENGIKELAVAP